MKFVPKGIIPPIITPLTEDGEVNYPVLRQMVNHLIENGVHGLFPLGTTGEFYAFDNDTYRKILETVKDETAGRVPVYGGANHITTRGVIELIKICEEVGVDAVSVLTPMFVSQTQDELYDYFATIAASTTLPIILYNVPGRTGCNIQPETVATLVRENENIVGLKEATGNMAQASKTMYLCDGKLDLYSGEDGLVVPLMAIGGIGVISVIANIAPQQTHDMCASYMAGDREKALELQMKSLPLVDALFSEVNPIPVKRALNLLGMEVGSLRAPLCEMSDANAAVLKQAMVEYGLL